MRLAKDSQGRWDKMEKMEIALYRGKGKRVK